MNIHEAQHVNNKLDRQCCSSYEESTVLRSLVGGPVDACFLEKIWQQRCAIFHANEQTVSQPLKTLIENGWDVLVNLLEEGREQRYNRELENGEDMPLVFIEQETLSPDTVLSRYEGSLFGAYLDGASIVLNHADLLSAPIARLCQDLQLSLPHAYANSYLTPPLSQAVPCHADDRDVLVVQVYGSKQWKVYQYTPVPYPYPHEQVGKNGLEVPASVLEGPLAIDTTLHPGDVLYMPRGFVHEAKTNANEPSFHVTVALATHDWTLAGVLTAATNRFLSSRIEYRKALPLDLGMKAYDDLSPELKANFAQLLDEAFDQLRQEVTVESLCQNMSYKFDRHNQRALERRMVIIKRQEQESLRQSGMKSNVGAEAAKYVTVNTVLRAATPEEKAQVSLSQHPRGLNVRQEVATAVVELLQRFKREPTWTCKIADLKQELLQSCVGTNTSIELVCDLTLLSFGKQCVEFGALAVVA